MAANDIEDLLLRIDATTEGLRRELKNTDKVIDKHTKDTNKQVAKIDKGFDDMAKSVRSSLGTVGKALGATAVATAGAVAALTVQTVSAAREINRLATVSGVGTREFQLYAAGAEALEIEQDKLGDIFKDTSDKVGDFIQTGGGPLADFFENIAPQVGVTADEFARLSGPKALELYVSSLEKANVSQNDMTFYMEAIASDATMLLPLLQNNAAGFKAFGEEADRAGAIMEQGTLEAANRLQATMWLLDQRAAGFKNQLMEHLLPELNNLSDEFVDLTADGFLAERMADTLAAAVRGIGVAAIAGVAGIDMLGKSIGGMAAVVSAGAEGGHWWERLSPVTAGYRLYKNWDKFKGTAAVVLDDLEVTADQYQAVFERLMNPSSSKGGDGKDRVEEIAKYLQALKTGLNAGAGGGAATEIEKSTQALIDKIKILEYTNQLMSLGVSHEQAKFEAEYKFADELERVAMIQQRLVDMQKYENDPLESPISRKNIEESQASIDEAKTYWEKYLDAAEEALTNLDDLAASTIETFSSGMGNALESIVFDFQSLNDAFDTIVESMARNMINALGKMAAEWLAYQTVQALVGKSTAMAGATTMTSNAQAASLQAGINAYSSTAAIPVIGPAAAPGAMAAALAATEPLAASVAALAASSFAGAFDEGGIIPAGKFGIAGEYGPEIIRGPANVTSREDTMRMFRSANEASGGDVKLRIVNVTDMSQVENFLGSDAGEKLIMNAASRNPEFFQRISRGS